MFKESPVIPKPGGPHTDGCVVRQHLRDTVLLAIGGVATTERLPMAILPELSASLQMVRSGRVRAPLNSGGDGSHGVAYTVAQKSDAQSLPGVDVG